MEKMLPPVVRIEPASACNLRCVHCPTGTETIARGLMKPETFARVLAEVEKHVPPIRVAVLYHGGEPFLNKRFLSMVRQVKDLGIPLVKTVSNGMLLKPEMMAEVVRSGLDLIEISLDSDAGSNSDKIRLRSSSERILESIRLLAEANRAAGMALRIFVSTTQFKRKMEITEDIEPAVPGWIREPLAAFPEIGFKPVWAMQWPAWSPGTMHEAFADVRPRAMPKSCSLLDETITIRADGSVVACCYDLLGKSDLGNIMNTDLADIWNAAHAEFSARFSQGDWPAPCDTCGHVTGPKYLVARD